ncbi:MAG TPA: hypothetical protein VJ746_11430 [Nitrospira sp.]|nr:hypothetical protein [Nitrospira sp.]
MDDKILDRLLGILTAQHVMLTALISAVQQLGLTPEKAERTLQISFRFAESYHHHLKELLTDAHLSEEQEKQLWMDLGLGDLWRPSRGPDDTR